MAETHREEAGKGAFNGGFPREYLKGCISRLRDCADELAFIGAGTEDSFLLIGERLRDFLNRSRKISEDAYAAVNMVSGEEIVRAIERLNGLLRGMEQRVRDSEVESNIYVERLKGILGLSDDVMGTMKAFASTVVDLGTAGTPLKDTLASGPEEGGAGIEAMTTVIKSGTSKVYDGLSSLRKQLDKALADILARAGDKETDYGAVLQDTAESLSTLTEKYGLSTGVASMISERSSEVSSSINEVVVSLQFHDITRQKLEGIGRGLWRLSEAVEAALDAKNGRRGATTVEDVHTACSIQIELLDMAREEFVAAVESMKDHLLRISSNISGISEKTRGLVCSTAESSRTFLYGIREALSLTSAALQDLSNETEIQKELSLALSSAIGSASEHARVIEDISAEVEKILRLPVARKDLIGLEGTVLSMILESAKCLSAQTSVLADSIGGLIESLSLFVSELSESSRAGAPLEGDPDAEIQKNLDAIIATLRNLNSNVRELLLSVDRSSENLLVDIKDTAEKINVHNTFDMAVDEIVSRLEGIAEGACMIVPSLKSMRLGRTGRRAAPRTAEERGPERVATDADGGLGDNVELF